MTNDFYDAQFMEGEPEIMSEDEAARQRRMEPHPFRPVPGYEYCDWCAGPKHLHRATATTVVIMEHPHAKDCERGQGGEDCSCGLDHDLLAMWEAGREIGRKESESRK